VKMDPKWRKAGRKFSTYVCTYGADADVVPRAPTLQGTCGANAVCVDGRDEGVGRCKKHAPRAFRGKS
jgi:hypothetical protein